MPKPIFGGQRLRDALPPEHLERNGSPLFYDEVGYAGPVRFSAGTTWAGLLKHAPLAARVHQPDGELLPPPWFPGYEAPVNLVYFPAQPGRLACGSRSPAPNPKAQAPGVPGARPVPPNPYLAFSAMLMAGNRRHQRTRSSRNEPVDKGPVRAPARTRAAAIPQVSGASLEDGAQTRLEEGPRLPARGRRCSPRTSSRPGIEYKRTKRARPGCGLRPSPHEFRDVLRRLTRSRLTGRPPARHRTAAAAGGLSRFPRGAPGAPAGTGAGMDR